MNALLIARRDLASYLQGYMAYIIFAVLLAFNGLLFYGLSLGVESAQYSHEVLESFFEWAWGCSVVVAVLVTMTSFSNERTSGTEVLLRTSVLSDADIVLGKWLAAMGVMALYAALTMHMPLKIFISGKVAVSHLAVGYFGILIGGGVAAALGVFCSALFRNWLAAGIVAGVLAVYMAVLAPQLAPSLSSPLADLVSYTALFAEHYDPIRQGRVELSSLVYHGSLIALFLALATYILNNRRWE